MMNGWISGLLIALMCQLLAPSPAVADGASYYPQIPLTQEEQQFVYDTAEQYGLSPELCLAVMAVESSFDPKATTGQCHGLMQLNENTYPALADQLGISHFDVWDFHDNVQAGILMLALERDYWLGEGYSDEEAFNALLISYNRGRAGARRYIEANGLEADYADKVLDYKTDLERSNAHESNS